MELPKNSRIYCCVKNCNSRACTESSLSFHFLPAEEKYISRKNLFGQVEEVSYRYLWIQALAIEGEVKPTWRVCSKYFSPQDYLSTGSQRRLKQNSIPSVHLPIQANINYTKSILRRKEREDSLENRKIKIMNRGSDHFKENIGDTANVLQIKQKNNKLPCCDERRLSAIDDNNQNIFQDLMQIKNFENRRTPIKLNIVDASTQTEPEVASEQLKSTSIKVNRNKESELQAPRTFRKVKLILHWPLLI